MYVGGLNGMCIHVCVCVCVCVCVFVVQTRARSLFLSVRNKEDETSVKIFSFNEKTSSVFRLDYIIIAGL